MGLFPIPLGCWQQMLDSEAERYGGSGQEGLPTVLHGGERHSVVPTPSTFAKKRKARKGAKGLPLPRLLGRFPS